MPFQVSPGVNVSEIDLSTTIPNVSVSDAAIAAGFKWGPANKVTSVTSEKNMVDVFGKPDNDTATNWLTAASFLAYAGSLQIVRTLPLTGALNASDESTGGSFESGGVIATIAPAASGTGYVVGNLVNIAGNASGGTTAIGYIAQVNSNDGEVELINVTSAGANAGSGYSAGTEDTTVNTGSGDGYLTVTITASTIVNDSAGVLVENEAEFDAGITFGSDTSFVARYPGVLGNSIGIGMVHLPTTVEWGAVTSNIGGTTYTWSNEFDTAPNATGGTDKVHILVTDTDGTISGTVGEILEKHAFLSIASDSKDSQGNSDYIVDAIRIKSKYIYATGNFDANTNLTGVDDWDTGTIATPTTFDSLDVPHAQTLTDGATDNSNTGANVQGQRQGGYFLFQDAEQVDVSLFLIGEEPDTTAFGLTDYVIGTIVTGASGRKDSVVFTSPALNTVQDSAPLGAKATSVVADRNKVSSSSYGIMDSSWKRMYNKYTDKFIAVPLNGDIAGLCVATDNNRDPWFSPAGFNRGHIKNAASLYFDPDKAARDTLYKGGVNPVASFPGQGIVLFGDKTLQATPSAFDRINVRRLFIVLEKAISRASRSLLFEFNDEFTRAQFRSMVDPFLRNVKSRRGIIDYLVVCDKSNNTGDVIDRNEFVGDIFIKPARSINFIQLNFVAVSTGVSFSEVVGAV